MPTRISIAKPDILKLFEGLPDPVLRQKDLAKILDANRSSWRLAWSTSTPEFIKFLFEHAKLKKFKIDLPHRPETLYTWGTVSPYALAAHVKPKAYLCHYTAMHLLGLTDQLPETIYANHEQRPIPPSPESLNQERVTAAFRRPQRLTTNIAAMGAHKLCLINGKHTDSLGVIEMKDEQGRAFRVTGLERTLIDITVRPAYAGGVSEILEAYKRAAGQVSLNKLAAMLQQMKFVYPYDQAIGFYLERSGVYEPARIDLFRKRQFTINFYLTYAMTKPDFSERWRLFYPAGF
jgi:AbiEi antitoxin C-terminal domain